MNIIKFHDMKRIKYNDLNGNIKFITPPKIFTDYRRYIKSPTGEIILDNEYNYNAEIVKQLDYMKKRIDI